MPQIKEEKEMTDIHTKFIIENVNQKMMDYICNSEGHVDEFYKSLNSEELFIYANESKRLGDTETYDKL
jgi:hypothetical protein